MPTCLFRHWNANDLQFAVLTIDARFNLWLIPIVCTQLQLNLRTAVHHVPSYVTNYYQRRAVANIDSTLSSSGRPGTETILFGHTITELELMHSNFSNERDGSQDERQSTPAAVPTSAQGPPRRTGKKTLTVPPADFCTGKEASVLAIAFHGISETPSRHSLALPLQGDPPLGAPASNQQVGAQVGRRREPGVSQTPQPSPEDENARQGSPCLSAMAL